MPKGRCPHTRETWTQATHSDATRSWSLPPIVSMLVTAFPCSVCSYASLVRANKTLKEKNIFLFCNTLLTNLKRNSGCNHPNRIIRQTGIHSFIIWRDVTKFQCFSCTEWFTTGAISFVPLDWRWRVSINRALESGTVSLGNWKKLVAFGNLWRV